MRKLKPKGKRGRAMVKKLGRNYKTGMFDKIAQKAAKKYGSKEAGKRVAAAVFWKKVRNRIAKSL
jgi:hypothetical protein